VCRGKSDDDRKDGRSRIYVSSINPTFLIAAEANRDGSQSCFKCERSFQMNIPKLLRPAVILLCIQFLGCSYQEQLEKVAKDWCMTIRASQVIPVYPLTEDLEPGDVFLVQTCVPRQAEQYKKKGFLPLDMHMVRLDIPEEEFDEFYDGFYGLDPCSPAYLPPHIWQTKPVNNNEVEKPTEVEEPNGNNIQKRAKPAGHRDPTNWHKAPRAGFPTYTFEVERGIAGAAALPVKGIPVAMSLLGADKAAGSVTIKDSYTYGVPYDNLVQKLSTWAWENKDLLHSIREGVIDAEPFPDQLWRFLSSPFAGHLERTIYLRIINRVYLTGSLTVTMTNTSAAAVKAATKSFKDARFPSLDSTKDVNNYTKNIEAINQTLSPQHPDTGEGAGAVGAALNVTSATFRSISLDERFDRPLVIGYLAFDFPVLEGGGLGTPVSTINQVSSAPVTTRIKPLSPKSSQIVAGMLQRIHDDLNELGKTDPSARSYLKKLNKAAVTILCTHDIPDYGYSFVGPNTLEITTFENPSTVDVQTLVSRWEHYQDCVKAMTKAIAALVKEKVLKVFDNDEKELAKLVEGKPLVIEGKEIASDGSVWLRKKRDSYIAQRKKLDEQIQSCPEITRVIDYYFSIFRPDR